MTTDENGVFQTECKDLKKAWISVWAVGYYTVRQALDGRKDINIILIPESKYKYNETTVLPFRVETNEVTTSAENITKKDFTPASMNIDRALAGQIAGLQVTRGSGMPGEGSYMNLRGVRSVSYTHLSSLSDPTIGSTVQKVSSGDSKVRNINGIGVVNYTLLNRYVFNGTIGVESNSAMGKSERLGIFPAAGFAWHLADEPFMNNTDAWLDEFKLRFSVGEKGNGAEGTSIYLGSYASGDNYMNMNSIKHSSMQLNRLKWETTTKYNTGVDISLFKNRVSLTVDVYQTVSYTHLL